MDQAHPNADAHFKHPFIPPSFPKESVVKSFRQMDLRHVSLTKNVSHQGYFFSIGETADLNPRLSLSLICRHYSGIAGGNPSCWLLFAPLALEPFLELLRKDHFFLTAQEGRGMGMGQILPSMTCFRGRILFICRFLPIHVRLPSFCLQDLHVRMRFALV